LLAYREQLAKYEEMTAGYSGADRGDGAPGAGKNSEGGHRQAPERIQAIMNKPASERTPYEQQINDLAYGK